MNTCAQHTFAKIFSAVQAADATSGTAWRDCTKERARADLSAARDLNTNLKDRIVAFTLVADSTSTRPSLFAYVGCLRLQKAQQRFTIKSLGLKARVLTCTIDPAWKQRAPHAQCMGTVDTKAARISVQQPFLRTGRSHECAWLT
jgi:hypothetical protein